MSFVVRRLTDLAVEAVVAGAVRVPLLPADVGLGDGRPVHEAVDEAGGVHRPGDRPVPAFESGSGSESHIAHIKSIQSNCSLPTLNLPPSLCIVAGAHRDKRLPWAPLAVFFNFSCYSSHTYLNSLSH